MKKAHPLYRIVKVDTGLYAVVDMNKFIIQKFFSRDGAQAYINAAPIPPAA